ncbi:uncharacterized protein LOC131024552 [Salvia miltiorrhiza]|uniref:uncharacterized protein LOC131024552 n=1 Tax=Salvia miltiorrhiza TaxID=226208 RepID=UPI0025AD5766|nr:uncharacterized protein LOC131024552 [Salvia miltiorrhiza]
MAPPKPQNVPPLPPHEDSSNPLYLSHSDNPGVQLVTQQLTGSNYSSWYRSMTTALMAKNKLAFVDGTIERPHPTENTYAQWMRCNSMVVSWIRNSVIPEISSSVMYIDDARLIWNDLNDRFSQGNLARICQLKQQLHNLKQGSEDVGSYFTKLRIIWDEYKDFQPNRWCTCDTCRCHSSKKWNEYQMQECSMQFLIGLNSSFSQIRSQIISMTPFPSLSRIFALVSQEERQRVIESVPPMTQFNVESSGSIVNATGYARGRGNKGKLLCTHCGKTNHTIDKCFAIIGYPPGYGRGRGKPQSNMQENVRSINHISTEPAPPSQTNSVLSAAEMTQMLSFLQNQMQALKNTNFVSPVSERSVGEISTSASATTPFSGSFTGDNDWEG